MFKFPGVHPHSHHDDNLNLIARDGHDHGHGNGHDDNVEHLSEYIARHGFVNISIIQNTSLVCQQLTMNNQNTSLAMVGCRRVWRGESSTRWSLLSSIAIQGEVSIFGTNRVLLFKVLPFKVPILSFFNFEYFIAIQDHPFRESP